MLEKSDNNKVETSHKKKKKKAQETKENICKFLKGLKMKKLRDEMYLALEG